MKLNKSKKPVVTVKGPIVAIGGRGVIVTELPSLPGDMKLGLQPIMEKKRGEDHSMSELWVKAGMFMTSSAEPRKVRNSPFVVQNGDRKVAAVLLDTFEHARKTRRIVVHPKLKFRQGKNTFTADVISAPGWNPKSDKQPSYLGVLHANGYRHKRIESTLIREADGSESRNKHLVARLVR